MKTLLVQSASVGQCMGWQGQTLQDAKRWASHQGMDYRFVGDEIFDLVPAWYLAKCTGKLPVATDYARLLLLQQALQEGYEQAIWLDADVLVLDSSLRVEFAGTCAFGLEVWIERKQGKLVSRRNVHNAIVVFRQHCPVLPFLIRCVESLMRRVDAAHLAPQFVGPKLLQALHPFADFALLPEVGALSPLVVADILAGGGPALDVMCQHSPLPKAVNLCASLLSAQEGQALVESVRTTLCSLSPNTPHD